MAVFRSFFTSCLLASVLRALARLYFSKAILGMERYQRAQERLNDRVCYGDGGEKDRERRDFQDLEGAFAKTLSRVAAAADEAARGADKGRTDSASATASRCATRTKPPRQSSRARLPIATTTYTRSRSTTARYGLAWMKIISARSR